MLGHQTGRQVQPAGGGGVADGVGVAGRDAADGINGVVDGCEHVREVAGGGGEVCGVAGRGGVSAGGCPARVVVGEPRKLAMRAPVSRIPSAVLLRVGLWLWLRVMPPRLR